MYVFIADFSPFLIIVSKRAIFWHLGWYISGQVPYSIVNIPSSSYLYLYRYSFIIEFPVIPVIRYDDLTCKFTVGLCEVLKVTAN